MEPWRKSISWRRVKWMSYQATENVFSPACTQKSHTTDARYSSNASGGLSKLKAGPS